jgi:hypothetical protein
MSWVATGVAVGTGAGVAGFFGKRGKKASVNLNLPQYKASQYDAPMSGQLFGTISDRMAGRNVGYSPEDIATMNAQVVDQSARASNDYTSKSMAGRQYTGGMTRGGTNLVRDKALMYGGGLRAEGLRDIAIKNAVQKRKEIGEAIPLGQTFLGAERDQAQQLYGNEMQQALMQKEEADKVQAYNKARKDADWDFATDSISSAAMGFGAGMPTGTQATNPNPYAFGYDPYAYSANQGFGSNNDPMYSAGQYLSRFKKK